MRNKIVLIGFIGAGKTAVGRVLAGNLGLPFLDIDAALETRQGRLISEIIGEMGVERFRDQESAILREFLEGEEPAVIATGGGTLMRPPNRWMIRKRARAIWLKASPETVWKRVQNKPYVAPLFYTRPDPLAAIWLELERRERYYQETAEFALEVDGKTPEAAAKEIEEILKEAIK